ncbi:hypothetical protein B0H65DRAFT_439582 [Neurospora tetraspora]|uniref:Mitochondrial carrier n=1 Tax=Neurospora tetraspora TaxID=94610 RepID=A0AAE0MTN1_9PEZI|nr:hypothetical protein B0H65DRAFT_439582 [Neurospora tetraspora]
MAWASKGQVYTSFAKRAAGSVGAQPSKQSDNSIDCFRKVIRNEGFKGLYSTWLPVVAATQYTSGGRDSSSAKNVRDITGSLNAVLWTSFVMMAYIYIDAARREATSCGNLTFTVGIPLRQRRGMCSL